MFVLCVKIPLCIVGSEDNLAESKLSIHYVVSGTEVQASIRPAPECPPNFLKMLPKQLKISVNYSYSVLNPDY